MSTTRLSSKGQVIIPKSIRDERGWQAGTAFDIEERPEGLLLKPRPAIPRTTIDDAFGCMHYDGPVRSIEDMDEAVAAEARRRAKR